MNNDAKHAVLVLDDDEMMLAQVGRAVESIGCRVLLCSNVVEAVRALAARPVAAVVDLFLMGNTGDALSNGFVRDELLPRQIPYVRLTSAPHLVPTELRGSGLIHKHEFDMNPSLLTDILAALLP